MKEFIRRFEILIIALLVIWGSVFMLKMAYLSVWSSTLICIAYLAAIYAYLRIRYDMRVPLSMMVLVYLTVALDGFGNLFGLYNRKFAYIQYDEFTHTAAPALAMPVIVWLLRSGMARFGYRLPLALVTFFAITVSFTVSGFYEIIELWDDKYMWPQPGMRIHGPYDTPNDLQCDLLGMIIGGVIAYYLIRRKEGKQPQTT